METIELLSTLNGVAMIAVELETDAVIEVNYENRAADRYAMGIQKKFKPGQQLIQLNYSPYIGKGYRLWLFVSDTLYAPSRGSWSEMVDDLDRVPIGELFFLETPNGF